MASPYPGTPGYQGPVPYPGASGAGRRRPGATYNPAGPGMAGGGGGGGATFGGQRRGGGLAQTQNFGDPFTEAGLNSYVYRDPSLFIQPMFNERFGGGWNNPAGGGGLGGNLVGMMEQSAENINPLYFLFRGQGATPGQGTGGAAFTDFATSFLNNQLTPGVYTDVQGGIGNLQNPTGLLAEHLYANGDAAGQVQAYLELARGLASQGMHPMMAAAYLDSVARNGKSYIAGTAQGQAMPAGGFGGYAGRNNALF